MIALLRGPGLPVRVLKVRRGRRVVSSVLFVTCSEATQFNGSLGRSLKRKTRCSNFVKLIPLEAFRRSEVNLLLRRTFERESVLLCTTFMDLLHHFESAKSALAIGKEGK